DPPWLICLHREHELDGSPRLRGEIDALVEPAAIVSVTRRVHDPREARCAVDRDGEAEPRPAAVTDLVARDADREAERSAPGNPAREARRRPRGEHHASPRAVAEERLARVGQGPRKRRNLGVEVADDVLDEHRRAELRPAAAPDAQGECGDAEAPP